MICVTIRTILERNVRMDLFDVLTMIGGLCLFLFGMNIMGQALERRAGSKLRSLLHKLTTNRLAGLLTGLAVTAVIQSSSATTVMVVGFVNSGLMTLGQAINVIMGANVGTTVTAWILSLGGIESSNMFVSLLKPSAFSPVLALVGIICYMFCKSDKKKDTGTILLGFATLMFGMETMSGAVSGLAQVPAFRNLFLLFQNPVLGVLAGAVLTAVIQSSSASVGILQTLADTGQVTFGAAVPIIMGQNIGTCITALISSVGTNKNAKRAAIVHLLFNIIGTTFCLILFMVVQTFWKPALLAEPSNRLNIAVAHSVFNVFCTLLLLPQGRLLERLVTRLVPDAPAPESVSELDERLLATPPVALDRCRTLAAQMAATACEALRDGVSCLTTYTSAAAERVRSNEDKTDHYEDILGTYLVKLSTQQISEHDSSEAAGLLKVIGDFERIGDHSVNLLESAEEMREKNLAFTKQAREELGVICSAVREVLDLAVKAFTENDLEAAARVEPLEQVIDGLKETLRTRHILRLQKGQCSIEAGFVWADLLTGLERTSDHCSNIAACVMDMAQHNMNLHASVRSIRSGNEAYDENFKAYRKKYNLEAAVH